MVWYREKDTFTFSSGVLFAIAWWVAIDSVMIYPTDAPPFIFGFWMPGIVASIGLVMINLVPWAYLQPEDESSYSMDDDPRRKHAARACLLFALLVSLGSIVASIWIYAAVFVNTKRNDWAGASQILLTTLCLLSAVVFRIGKRVGQAEQGGSMM